MSGHTWGRPTERGCVADVVAAVLLTVAAFLVGERLHRFPAESSK